MNPTLKRLLGVLVAPFVRLFELGLRSTRERMEEGRRHFDSRLDTVETRVTWVDQRVVEVKGEAAILAHRLDRFDELESRLTTDAQTMTELAGGVVRASHGLASELAATRAAVLPGVGAQVADLATRAAEGDPEADVELAKLLVGLSAGAADKVVSQQTGITLDRLGPGGAEFLNWAAGHTGPAAQAGVWLNPPVTIEYSEGQARTNDVNERVVEVPYALAALAALPAGSAVLDFGASESTVSLSLASLGLRVTALDLRPYPFEHPGLRSVVARIEEWEGPGEPLDAVLSLSTLEHVGLGAYGETATGGDLDRRVLERIAGWLRPGGELVMTAPYGAWEVGATQRVYDAPHLDALLVGWRVLDRQVCVQTAHDRWERVGSEPPASVWASGSRGVVLLRATPDS